MSMRILKKEVVPKYPLVYRNVAINGNWSGYGFKLKNVQEIEHIDVKGKLGLWNLDI